jgi:endonuclease YncB( thermonuclease family)
MSNPLPAAVLAAVIGLGGAWAMREPTPADRSSATEPVAYRSVAASSRAYPVCSARVKRNCVVDGDTFYFGAEKIRLADIDAPETHPPRCALEADLGDRATTRLSELLSAGAFELARFDRDTDRYGRKLRVAMRDGQSLGDRLVSEGLARTWTGKRQPWCPDGDDGLG